MLDTTTAPRPPSSTRLTWGLFVTPTWLRDLGTSSWLAVGVTLFVVAAVAGPVVGWLERRRLARGLGAVASVGQLSSEPPSRRAGRPRLLTIRETTVTR